MAQCFPKVILKPERIIQSSGEEHRIITAGGASAWQDLLLYLIARFAGEEEARRAAKIYLLGDRSDGQLPFASMGAQRSHDDATVARCQEWLADHYDDPSPVSRMVDLSVLPARTFKRRFKAATGYTPIGYVQAMRVEEAKQLLETTDLPTNSIGKEVGYVEPAFFRRLFKRNTGIGPGTLPATFSEYCQGGKFRWVSGVATGEPTMRQMPQIRSGSSRATRRRSRRARFEGPSEPDRGLRRP